ncbi:MAG: hypothetical protein AAGJ37_00160 [Pseudomonadota bacterium]
MRAVLAVILFAAIVAFNVTGDQASDNRAEHEMLHGLSKDTLISIINDNGGSVTKEYKFINAIGASLNKKQLSLITGKFSERRVTKSSETNVSTGINNAGPFVERISILFRKNGLTINKSYLRSDM